MKAALIKTLLMTMEIQKFSYDNKIVKNFAYATIIWGITGMLVGLIVALQMAFPNFFNDYLICQSCCRFASVVSAPGQLVCRKDAVGLRGQEAASVRQQVSSSILHAILLMARIPNALALALGGKSRAFSS